MLRRKLRLGKDIAEYGALAATGGIHVALPALEAGLHSQIGLGMGFERQQQQG
jgi:hypothetical protein